MRKLLTAISALAALLCVPSIVWAGATPKVGAACAKANQVFSTGNSALVCIKQGSKLAWTAVPKKTVPIPMPAPTTSKVATPVVAEGDDQFFYGTYGCNNKIMFVRYNRAGNILRNTVYVSAKGNFELIPKFYMQGVLLFESYDCASKTETLYTLNTSDSSINPQTVYGPSSSVVDATIDVASKTPLVLILTGNTYQVVTGGIANTILWNGPTSSGFFPTTITTQTGSQFLLTGNYYFGTSKTGFGGYLVDYRQNFVGEQIYSPGTSLIFGNSVVAGNGWNAPLAFNTKAGIYLCGTPAKYPMNVQTDAHCTLVANSITGLGSMAFSYGPNTTYDFIVGSTIYSYPFPSSFLSYNQQPTIIGTTPNLNFVVANNDYVSTFEILSDLGKFDSPWNFYGTYFSHG